MQLGDSWFSIAGSEMGDQRYAGDLARANPGFDVLKPGTVIMLPPAGGEETPILTYEDYEMLEGIQEKVEEAQEPPVTAANSPVYGDPAGIEAEHDMIQAYLDRQEADETPVDEEANGLEEEFNVADYEAEAQAIAQMLLEMQALREQEEEGSIKVAALAQDVVLQEETQEQKEANELLDTWFQTQVADMKILGQDNYRAIHNEYKALQNGISQGSVTRNEMFRRVYGTEYVPTPTPTPTEGLPPPIVEVRPLETDTPEPILTPEPIRIPTAEPTAANWVEVLESYAPMNGDGFFVSGNRHGTEILKGLHVGVDIAADDRIVEANVAGKVYFFQTLKGAGGIIETRAFDPALEYPENDDSYEDFGNYVVLVSEFNGETYYQVFAHLESFSHDFQNGDEVPAGTLLGEMGKTGATEEYHVHWEIRTEDGVNIDENGVIRFDIFERVLADGTYPTYYAQSEEELEQFTINPYDFTNLLNSIDN
ncbi:MAG: M23 family metallopeptidase [Chloroflexi bacterium]|nr:M23 family metallopeptidase [Chloroflexota bacterium]